MFINELFEDDSLEGYRTEKNDQSVRKMADVRKTRLTLSHIKRLRQMNDLKKFEDQKKVQELSKQYKPAAAAGMAPGL